MKYMTKQWYMDMQRETLLPYDLQVDACAKQFSEKDFRKLYAQKKAEWLAMRAELMEDWGEPFNSKEEAMWFAQNYRKKTRRLLSDLPQEILNKVADIRVLALGYCTECVYNLCQEFIENNRAAYRSVLQAYDDYINRELKDIPFINANFHDGVVKSLRRKGNALVLEFDDPEGALSHNRIVFRNAMVLQQDGRLCGADWLYNELYKNADGYEIHALLWRHWKLIDFIVQCSDVEVVD